MPLSRDLGAETDPLRRNAQIVGNGLVTFDYPSEAGERAEGEWETLGYSKCREELLLRAEQLEKDIKAAEA